ncbi:MAG: hypothetical protein LBU98_02325 [Alistipes sp.]|jgi:hypothetical protein|nr:hypothetical protein [Alistipes sp.]
MNKRIVYCPLVLGAVVLTIIGIGAVKIKKMSDNVVKLSYLVLEKDADINAIESYLIKNIELLDTDSDELAKTLAGLGIDTKGVGYVALFPINGCGSCVTMLCFALEDLEIDKNTVHIIAESENVTMRSELRGSGYTNYHSNKAPFDDIPDSENITFVAFKNGKCKMMKFDIGFPEYVKIFLGHDL